MSNVIYLENVTEGDLRKELDKGVEHYTRWVIKRSVETQLHGLITLFDKMGALKEEHEIKKDDKKMAIAMLREYIGELKHIYNPDAEQSLLNAINLEENVFDRGLKRFIKEREYEEKCSKCEIHSFEEFKKRKAMK